jgi:KDO2-lipid IV(A) lauroyltransferase
MKYQLIYGLVKLLISLARIFPRGVSMSFCAQLGLLYYRFSSGTVKLVRTHLKMAFPEKSDKDILRLSKRVFEMMGRNAADIIRSFSAGSSADLEKSVVIHGLDRMEQAIAKDKGVVFVSAHVGAFDLIVTVMALRGYRPHIIGTPLKDPRLNDLLWKHRNQFGAVAIERGKETFRMMKALRSGGTVALLIDLDTKVKSVFNTFFGMPAATPIGATTLAMVTGAAVVPICIYLGEDNLQHIQIEPEVLMRNSGNEQEDIVYNTQQLTTIIEGWVRAHPEQWTWMHERWKTKVLEN